MKKSLVVILISILLIIGYYIIVPLSKVMLEDCSYNFVFNQDSKYRWIFNDTNKRFIKSSLSMGNDNGSFFIYETKIEKLALWETIIDNKNFNLIIDNNLDSIGESLDNPTLSNDFTQSFSVQFKSKSCFDSISSIKLGFINNSKIQMLDSSKQFYHYRIYGKGIVVSNQDNVPQRTFRFINSIGWIDILVSVNNNRMLLIAFFSQDEDYDIDQKLNLINIKYRNKYSGSARSVCKQE